MQLVRLGQIIGPNSEIWSKPFVEQVKTVNPEPQLLGQVQISLCRSSQELPALIGPPNSFITPHAGKKNKDDNFFTIERHLLHVLNRFWPKRLFRDKLY